jgi:hypothetical protein
MSRCLVQCQRGSLEYCIRGATSPLRKGVRDVDIEFELEM